MKKEDYKNAAKDFKSKIVVTGKTVVNHKLRIKLSIGCNAYVILDYFKRMKKLDYIDIEKKTGFNAETVDKLVENLYNQQLISYNKTRTSLKASSKFFNEDLISRQFIAFWNLSQISTKQKTSAWPDAMERVKKVFVDAVELEGFDYIMQRRDFYIRHLELQQFEFKVIMSAARFLGTTNKEYAASWESQLPDQGIKKEVKPITKQMLKSEYE